ncbi:MAG: deoxyuridine 5'-triphosphate nucleotidohydrolase [Lachnospiraceae bacterium]|nr:deoxyuridine 5'-triphosphate nucleotidohydrolase [Lachnospiraceae bacterium]
MKRIGKFHKVSFQRFREDWENAYGSREDLEVIYRKIQLPQRATKGSAGYDFYAPVDIVLQPGEGTKVFTGIRVEMDESWVLTCYPRSGLGFKYRMQLDNTVGVIDSDYFYSDNEGHIQAKITNDSREGKTLTIAAGTGFMQGIFLEYGITVDDDASGIRNGGLGSTTFSQ